MFICVEQYKKPKTRKRNVYDTIFIVKIFIEKVKYVEKILKGN